MHNGKYLTFTGSNGSYTYKGENNSGTELKLNKNTYNFIANELPAREEYTVYEVSGTTGYSFSIDPVTFTITPAGSVKKVFTNKAMTGTISIVKRSADGVLSGWQFRVTGTAKTGQSYDKTFTTDAKGTITISNLRIGDYKVTEVKTGKTVGYITENGKDIEVKTDTVTTVNFENKPYANIVINKVDAKTGEKVTGATFGIYTDAECEIPAQAYTSATDDTLTDAVITESATGKYTCNFLPIESKDGTTYYVKELIAPEGYYLDTNVHAVTLQTANATVSVNNEIGKSDFNEYPYGHGAVIKEWKLDNGTADMTADEIAQMKAELEKSLYFTVKDRNGKYITATGADGIYTYNGDSTSEFRYTLKNSTFAIAELPTGDYTVTEFSTLSDYTIKSENPVKITVARNQTATATFVNERDTGTGKVIKVWKVFFANVKRGGILLTLIGVGSLYMLNLPRGYSDGFNGWIKQVIALCFTSFMQTTLFFTGLITIQSDWLIGTCLILSATEVPRIADRFGLDTSIRGNMMAVSMTANTALSGMRFIRAVAK